MLNINKELSGVKVGSATVFGGLAVFPLIRKNRSKRDYLTLTEAFHKDGIEIRLPDRVDLSGPIRLEVRDTRIRVPARGLKMVFMPEIGPYSRLVTNSKGMVDLPVPDGSGVLRIETTPPQIVRIELKNS